MKLRNRKLRNTERKTIIANSVKDQDGYILSPRDRIDIRLGLIRTGANKAPR